MRVTRRAPPTRPEIGRRLAAANIITFARTTVERDYQGEVTDGHAPEMTTRVAKRLLSGVISVLR
jgi:hypothetical protein